MTRTGVGPPLQIATMGSVAQTDVDYARRKIEHVLARVGRPVLYARLRLTHAGDPAVSRPAHAQVNVDVDGRLVRAQVGAATMHEAADLVQARLADKLARAARTWESLRGGRPVAEPGRVAAPKHPGATPGVFSAAAGAAPDHPAQGLRGGAGDGGRGGVRHGAGRL